MGPLNDPAMISTDDQPIIIPKLVRPKYSARIVCINGPRIPQARPFIAANKIIIAIEEKCASINKAIPCMIIAAVVSFRFPNFSPNEPAIAWPGIWQAIIPAATIAA